ncbi:MAG: 2-amino-4-hydroxy-6-hydroxymethyldihydropteridine diphosphokinase [Peptococcaceae bacterium]|jgi:2-amino-4-hydroxy-6-hydroxymethyldihydropteridine diphosphokinase|nr:2-amino-4-hydroxy-6-hydroxymethyldihydropteridine diphosphokinase [Peptococcaceae bacterium]
MIAYLSLGSNQGDKRKNLEMAIELLAKSLEIKILSVSSFYETEPWGNVEQDSFLNMALKIDTTLSPLKLLHRCLEIEGILGRKREMHWGPRIIDIDILIYQDVRVDSDELTIPHPYMEQREFVLAPLREIAPELILPSGQKVKELRGQGLVQKKTFK